MKKNFFYSVMAAFTLLFMAACSQEEIISNNGTNGGKVVLSVNVSGATPDTRAVADVQGYVMRCIMEAVDTWKQWTAKGQSSKAPAWCSP